MTSEIMGDQLEECIAEGCGGFTVAPLPSAIAFHTINVVIKEK